MMNCEEKQSQEPSCASCNGKEVKYRCPSCSRRTCSLQCVKEHKKAYSCNGIRCKTSYVSKTDYNYNNMINDYRMLEDTERVAYIAGSGIKQRPSQPNRLVKVLIMKAKQSGVELKIMPNGMSKRKMNTTQFHRRQKCIMWRIRMLFPQADSEYVNKKVSEHKVLVELLKHYIDPTEGDPIIRQRLKPYLQTPADKVSVFMKVEHQPANKERYYKLDPLKTLKENLSGKTIIEFPTLHIVLPEKAAMYPVEMDGKLSQLKQETSMQQGEDGKLNQPKQENIIHQGEDYTLPQPKQENTIQQGEDYKLNQPKQENIMQTNKKL